MFNNVHFKQILSPAPPPLLPSYEQDMLENNLYELKKDQDLQVEHAQEVSGIITCKM